MPQQYIFTKYILFSIRRLSPSPIYHVTRHFQNKAACPGISSPILISNVFRRYTCITSNLYMSKNLRHLSSNYPRSPKGRQASAEVDDDESSEDDKDDSEGDERATYDGGVDSSVVPKVSYKTSGVNSFSKRTHTCGELNSSHVDQKVTLYGWIEAKRGDNFIILRDAYGCVQICLADYKGGPVTAPPESVISIVGTVIKRTPEHINEEMATGEIEVVPTEIKVLSAVQKRLPFSFKGYNKPKENLRLKHRYLHFRFPEMQHALRLRSNVLHKMRRYLVEDCSFVEVETPTLFGKTPGGAQEFVVPTKHKGKCYSLVQSPQQFKQMLMVGGVDRYFQVARCYRDEDSRSDRQPEFTQLDLEMSFTDMEGIMSLTEEILKHSWPEEQCGPLRLPFPRLTYKTAMELYGTDKPDLRYPVKIMDYTNKLTAYFQHRDENNVRLLTYTGKASCFSENLLKDVETIVEGVQSELHPVVVKVFPYDSAFSFHDNLKAVLPEKVIDKVFSTLDGTEPGDLVVVGHGHEDHVSKVLSAVRIPVAKLCGIPPLPGFHPLWVTHFPLFDKGLLIGQFKAMHHPFTAITKDSSRLFVGSPLQLKALAYDLVINGVEIGGGSERIKDPDFQAKVLQKIGTDPRDLEYFINALSYGCPPHAGIALGVDRLLACLVDAPSIRDVIAFPKTVDGAEPLTGAPLTPSSHDKARYRLK